MLSGQQIYDKVKAHLLKQNVRSADRGACLYRGPWGRKCAAGVLISDENYSEDFEEAGVFHEYGTTILTEGVAALTQALIDSGVDPAWMDLVSSLQDIHDNAPVERWALNLAKCAKSYGLKP